MANDPYSGNAEFNLHLNHEGHVNGEVRVGSTVSIDTTTHLERNSLHSFLYHYGSYTAFRAGRPLSELERWDFEYEWYKVSNPGESGQRYSRIEGESQGTLVITDELEGRHIAGRFRLVSPDGTEADSWQWTNNSAAALPIEMSTEITMVIEGPAIQESGTSLSSQDAETTSTPTGWEQTGDGIDEGGGSLGSNAPLISELQSGQVGRELSLTGGGSASVEGNSDKEALNMLGFDPSDNAL